MKKPAWHTPVEANAAAKRQRIYSRNSIKEARGEGIRRNKIKIRPRDPKHLYKKAYHTELHINGAVLKVVTRSHLVKFLGVSNNTIQSWYNQGVFGEPFMVDRSAHGHEVQYWLIRQMACFLRVLNDILKHGYLFIKWSNFPDQVESIHRGMEHYGNLAAKRLDKPIELIDNVDKFGVMFIDE